MDRVAFIPVQDFAPWLSCLHIIPGLGTIGRVAFIPVWGFAPWGKLLTYHSGALYYRKSCFHTNPCFNHASMQSDQSFHCQYCRFGNFCERFIYVNKIKRHISDVRDSRLRQDLPISINDRVILPFHEGFIFTKLRIYAYMRSFAKKSPRESFRIYSILVFRVHNKDPDLA